MLADESRVRHSCPVILQQTFCIHDELHGCVSTMFALNECLMFDFLDLQHHAQEFSTLGALNELYKYIQTYNPQVCDAAMSSRVHFFHNIISGQRSYYMYFECYIYIRSYVSTCTRCICKLYIESHVLCFMFSWCSHYARTSSPPSASSSRN